MRKSINVMRRNNVALAIVARAYGENFNCEVIVNGSSAYTNGQSIVIPAISDDYAGKDAIWGYLAHEAAHVRFTNFNCYANGKPVIQHLNNIVEDGRIENLIIETYPGVKSTLNACEKHCLDAGHYEPVDDAAEPVNVLIGLCLYDMRANVRQSPYLQGHYSGAIAVARQIFGDKTVDALLQLLKTQNDLESTQDSLQLAQDIFMLMEQAKDDTDDTNDDSDSTDQSDSDEGDSDSATGGDANSDDEQGDDDQNEESSDGSETGSSDDSGDDSDDSGDSSETCDSDDDSKSDGDKQAGGGSGDRNNGDITSDQSQAIEDALNGSPDYVSTQDKIAKDLEQSSYDDNALAFPELDELPLHCNDVRDLSQVSALAVLLRNQLHRLVMANGNAKKAFKDSGNRIATKRLARVANKDYKVFKRQKKHNKPDTSVQICLDISGSMDCHVSESKTRIDVATEATLAIAIALKTIKHVETGITVFHNEVSTLMSMGVNPQSTEVIRSMSRLGCPGSTQLDSGVMQSTAELQMGCREKKLLVVITDGCPNDFHAAKEAIAYSESQGIEIVGIGIGQDLDGLIDDNCCINDVNDLKLRLFDLMKNKLA